MMKCFLKYVSVANTYFETQNTIEVKTELDVIIYFESGGIISTVNTKYHTNYDENRSYYYEELNSVSDDYTDDQFALQTIDNIVIDVEDDTLHMYSVHNRAMTLDYSELGGEFATYVEDNEGVNSFDLDLDYCDTVELTSDNVFTCTQSFRDFATEQGLLVTLVNMGFESLLDTTIYHAITFDDYGYKTTIELSPIQIQFTVDETVYILSLGLTQEIIIGNHGDVVHPFFGGWVYTLPDTLEGIEFIAPMYYEIQNNEYYVNDIGWIAFDLDAGFYSFAVNGGFETYTYQVYDEEGIELKFNYRVEITEDQTYYIKIDSDEPQTFYIHFEPISITDIIIEDDYSLLSGSISGYNEGMDDYNGYHTDQVAPYDGLLTLDVSNIDFDDFFTISYGNGFGCWANDVDYCHIEINQGEEVYFEIFAEYVGNYDFSYSFNELSEYPTDLSLMRNIDEFSSSNPIYLGEDVNEVSIKFEVTEANKTFFIDSIYDGSAKLIYEIDLYNSEGVLLIENFKGYHDLDIGTYVIKYQKSTGILIVMPSVFVYDRP